MKACAFLEYRKYTVIPDHFVNTRYCYQVTLQDEYGIDSIESNQNCFECSLKFTFISIAK